MKRKISFALMCVFISACAFSGCSYKMYVSDSFVLFGSEIVCSIDVYSSSAANGRQAIDEMKKVMSALDDEINIYKSSKLKYFNDDAAINEEVEISKDCFAILKFSKDLFEKTNGLFNISVLPLVKLWKLDPDSKLINKNDVFFAKDVFPKIEDVERVKAECDLNRLVLLERDGKFFISKSAPLMLDLGGIAKGYAADMCKEVADRYLLDSMLVNISGNLYLYKKQIDGLNEIEWTVYVTDPRSKGLFFKDSVCALKTDGDVSVVTSGDYERFYRAGYRQNEIIFVPHIVNPITGMPYSLSYNEETKEYYNVDGYITGLTVKANSSMLADGLSTASIIAGKGEAANILKQFGAEGLFFTEDLKYYASEEIIFTNTEEVDKYKDFERIN